jgi:hypothetical protein
MNLIVEEELKIAQDLSIQITPATLQQAQASRLAMLAAETAMWDHIAQDEPGILSYGSNQEAETLAAVQQALECEVLNYDLYDSENESRAEGKEVLDRIQSLVEHEQHDISDYMDGISMAIGQTLLAVFSYRLHWQKSMSQGLRRFRNQSWVISAPLSLKTGSHTI